MTYAELVVFPDPQELLCSYLRDRLEERGYTNIFVGTKVPTNRPKMFVRVMVVGGERRSVKIDAPRLVVESWGSTESEASDLAEMNRALIFAMDRWQGTQVYNVQETARPTNLPDPLSTHERFTATYIVPVSGYVI